MQMYNTDTGTEVLLKRPGPGVASPPEGGLGGLRGGKVDCGEGGGDGSAAPGRFQSAP